MTINEIERLWTTQSPPAPQGAPAALTSQIRREIRHHRWFRLFMVGTVLFGIVASQVLFYVNGLYAASYNSPLHQVSLVLTQIINVAILYGLVRSLRRKREILRQRGETLRAVVGAALANVESELADYRGGYAFVLIALATAGLSIYANFPDDWRPIVPRVAFVLVLVGGIALLIRRHCRRNLLPEQARLRQTLEQLRD